MDDPSRLKLISRQFVVGDKTYTEQLIEFTNFKNKKMTIPLTGLNAEYMIISLEIFMESRLTRRERKMVAGWCKDQDVDPNMQETIDKFLSKGKKHA